MTLKCKTVPKNIILCPIKLFMEQYYNDNVYEEVVFKVQKKEKWNKI